MAGSTPRRRPRAPAQPISRPSARPVRGAARTQPGQRLSAADREQQIVAEAVRFFAEVGFGGQTRELARRAGITQSLLYRYFSTKEELIERVYRETFLGRIDPAWTAMIGDRSRPLADRLIRFYREYARATYGYEWIRIYMFSALLRQDINRRYIEVVENSLLKPICDELRHHCGLPGSAVIPISELELEHVWVLHGGLFYYAVRKYIYESRVAEDFDQVVERAVTSMLAGLKAITGAVVAAS